MNRTLNMAHKKLPHKTLRVHSASYTQCMHAGSHKLKLPQFQTDRQTDRDRETERKRERVRDRDRNRETERRQKEGGGREGGDRHTERVLFQYRNHFQCRTHQDGVLSPLITDTRVSSTVHSAGIKTERCMYMITFSSKHSLRVIRSTTN